MYEAIKLDYTDLSPYLEKDTIVTHLKIYQCKNTAVLFSIFEELSF